MVTGNRSERAAVLEVAATSTSNVDGEMKTAEAEECMAEKITFYQKPT